LKYALEQIVQKGSWWTSKQSKYGGKCDVRKNWTKKMQSAAGKFYLTDVADTEQLFRLIQSILPHGIQH